MEASVEAAGVPGLESVGSFGADPRRFPPGGCCAERVAKNQGPAWWLRGCWEELGGGMERNKTANVGNGVICVY